MRVPGLAPAFDFMKLYKGALSGSRVVSFECKFFEENVRDVSSARCQLLTSLSSAGPGVQSAGL